LPRARASDDPDENGDVGADSGLPVGEVPSVVPGVLKSPAAFFCSRPIVDRSSGGELVSGFAASVAAPNEPGVGAFWPITIPADEVDASDDWDCVGK
jgi:hypothetical protein